ncbi:hypothetical protein K469DRAFT_752746 [Zopfia rhizophila CBS 207.26]|uniref:Uncharacterized protein n=1 Tax=Zopfia rhizophila CBS 207.26 TaxID=1314779 RepID=A0A6A6DPL4_9PEZI|nr:hypothetical protein K469DRAFT_752746 [Zopfia rhizophila CBS 207.26]
MPGVSKLLAPLFSGSGVKGHGNQSANLSGNHLQVNASVGLNSHQTVIQKAPDGPSTGSSLLLAAGAAAVGAAATALKSQPQPDIGTWSGLSLAGPGIGLTGQTLQLMGVPCIARSCINRWVRHDHHQADSKDQTFTWFFPSQRRPV